MAKQQLSERLEIARHRLKIYLDREAYMLSQDAVQSYGLGPKSLQRYSTDLADLQKAIKELQNEIESLESALYGQGARKVVGVIPRDW